MSDVTVLCFFASYLLALAFEVVRAMRGLSWMRWPAFAAAGAGLTAHTLYLWQRGRDTNLPPLLSSTQDWLLVVAWIACVLYLFVVASDRRSGVGLFALPLVLLFVLVSRFASDTLPQALDLDRESGESALRGWLMLHAALLGLGIAGVAAGIIASLMYLVQHRRLRNKQAGPAGMSLLSLERLAQWNRLSILVAVPLLSLGLAAGFLLVYLAHRQGGQISFRDPLVVASSAAWLVMVLILGRFVGTDLPSGRTVAIRTLLAFGFLLTTLLGLQLATGGGHALRERRPAVDSSATDSARLDDSSQAGDRGATGRP